MKISLDKVVSYNEVHQNNPLRWKIMYQQDNGDFVDQSGWMKCKDYFNDVVAFKQIGEQFSVYGFDNKVKFNEGGLYICLVNCTNKFDQNIGTINKQMVKDLGIEIWVADETIEKHLADKTKRMIYLPEKCWSSTYLISLVTYVIRLCNYDKVYSSWNDLWVSDAPSQTVDRAFIPNAAMRAKVLGFKLPPGFDNYWYFAGKLYNSKAKPDAGREWYTIHNNGCSNWDTHMEMSK